jgi:NADH:ubiquinone reductase (H+-translocating)
VKRIVIVGGGFGGVYAARALERLLRPGEAGIALVNRENYFVFQPLLPEVISGTIGMLDTVSPIRRLCPRTRLYTREIQSVDLDRRVVTLAAGMRPRAIELEYDYLIIAAGSATDLSGMPGMAEHAFAFRTLGDALRLRNHALEALEEADNETDAEFRARLLTFVVGGGGFSGVEVIAELNDFLRSAARSFQTIRPEEVRCILVHSGEQILPEMSPSLAAYAQRILAKRGVELKLKSRVVAATADSVMLKTGETIGARTIVSTVPSGPVPLIATLRAPVDKGRLIATPNLELLSREGQVWVLGDCARIATADGGTAPPTAQHATREARVAAENLVASMRGQPQKPFSFAGLGKLGSLGHHFAVAEIFGLRISGLLAWLLWRAIYLSKMPGFERKLRVSLDWLTALLFREELVQLRTAPSDNITHEHFEAGQVIFEEGDVGDRLYIVRSGAVEVLRNGARVASLGPGDYFGEMALLSKTPRTATVRAVEPTNVLAIAKADFNKILTNFPDVARQLTDLAERRGG